MFILYNKWSLGEESDNLVWVKMELAINIVFIDKV